MWRKGGPFNKIFLWYGVFNHEELLKEDCQRCRMRRALEDTNPGDTHLVCGQSSRFIGADHIRTTKGLDTGEVPDNCILLCHLFGSEGKARGDHGGEALWDGGDSKCHGDFEVVDSTMDNTSMGRIPEVPEVDNPNEDTNDGDNFGEHVTKVVQLAFKRSLLAYLRYDRLVNIANGCLLTGKYHDGLGTAIDDGSPLGEIK
jgi:hypothetical protein